MTIEAKTVYFEKPGPANTDDTLDLAKTRADELDIKSIVVASTSGATGTKATGIFNGAGLVVVASAMGYREPNTHGMMAEHRSVIEAGGGKVLVTGHAFGMLGRAVNRKFGAIQIDELIANVLRVFGQGMKVGCEISCMAADAGLVESGKECIAIGGTGKGADTAIVIKPSNTHNFFDTRVLEVICKPRG
jgi:uncharacterized protein